MRNKCFIYTSPLILLFSGSGIKEYFENSYDLYESLFRGIKGELHNDEEGFKISTYSTMQGTVPVVTVDPRSFGNFQCHCLFGSKKVLYCNLWMLITTMCTSAYKTVSHQVSQIPPSFSAMSFFSNTSQRRNMLIQYECRVGKHYFTEPFNSFTYRSYKNRTLQKSFYNNAPEKVKKYMSF